MAQRKDSLRGSGKTLQKNQYLSWIIKGDLLSAQERGIIPGRGGRNLKKNDQCIPRKKSHLT